MGIFHRVSRAAVVQSRESPSLSPASPELCPPASPTRADWASLQERRWARLEQRALSNNPQDLPLPAQDPLDAAFERRWSAAEKACAVLFQVGRPEPAEQPWTELCEAAGQRRAQILRQIDTMSQLRNTVRSKAKAAAEAAQARAAVRAEREALVREAERRRLLGELKRCRSVPFGEIKAAGSLEALQELCKRYPEATPEPEPVSSSEKLRRRYPEVVNSMNSPEVEHRAAAGGMREYRRAVLGVVEMVGQQLEFDASHQLSPPQSTLLSELHQGLAEAQMQEESAPEPAGGTAQAADEQAEQQEKMEGMESSELCQLPEQAGSERVATADDQMGQLSGSRPSSPDGCDEARDAAEEAAAQDEAANVASPSSEHLDAQSDRSPVHSPEEEAPIGSAEPAADRPSDQDPVGGSGPLAEGEDRLGTTGLRRDLDGSGPYRFSEFVEYYGEQIATERWVEAGPQPWITQAQEADQELEGEVGSAANESQTNQETRSVVAQRVAELFSESELEAFSRPVRLACGQADLMRLGVSSRWATVQIDQRD